MRTNFESESHLEIYALHSQNDPSKQPLVCDEPVQTLDVFTSSTLLVYQSIQGGPQIPLALPPRSENLVASLIGYRFPEFGVVEEVVVGPII